jgi:hypothetical protein
VRVADDTALSPGPLKNRKVRLQVHMLETRLRAACLAREKLLLVVPARTQVRTSASARASPRTCRIIVSGVTPSEYGSLRPSAISCLNGVLICCGDYSLMKTGRYLLG